MHGDWRAKKNMCTWFVAVRPTTHQQVMQDHQHFCQVSCHVTSRGLVVHHVKSGERLSTDQIKKEMISFNKHFPSKW